MEKVKIKDINTGAITEVKKSLASDYVGTGKFVIVENKKETTKKSDLFKENKEEK